MQKVQLGQSNLHVTPVTFGAWAIGGWMWGGNEKKDAIEAIHASLDKGVTSIDTAPVYGMGRSEELVADALEGKQRDKVEILTKFGLRWDTDKGVFHFKSQDNNGHPVNIHKYAGKEAVMKECEESLRRLKTDYIDLYQIHWPDKSTPISETMEALERLLEQGKIRAAGVCNYDAKQMEEAEKVITLASNQVPYSMVNRGIETDVVPYCLEHGNGILAYSPLQRGLLTGKITDDYEFKKGDHRPNTSFFKQPNLERINAMLDKIKPIAEQHGATLAQLVINWTVRQPGITVALVGARNAKQALQNADALNFELSDEEIAEIAAHLEELELAEV